jgi:hypothetical protein
MAAVCHLHRWGVGVAIDSYDFHPKALKLDDQLFAELAGSAKEYASRGWGERGADGGHSEILIDGEQQRIVF